MEDGKEIEMRFFFRFDGKFLKKFLKNSKEIFEKFKRNLIVSKSYAKTNSRRRNGHSNKLNFSDI